MQEIEIRSVMVPVSGHDLLLPNAAIAEVVSYTPPEPVPGSAEWLLGTMMWRGWQVPLISFARLIDQTQTETTQGARICITKTLVKNDKMPYIGILAQGHPRLITVTEENFVEVSTEGNPIGVAGQVTVNEREAMVPDLDRLGHLVAHAAFGALPLTS